MRPNEWFVLAGSYVHIFESELCEDWTLLVNNGYSPRLAWSDVLPSFRPGWIVLVDGPLSMDSARVRTAAMQQVVPEAIAWPGW